MSGNAHKEHSCKIPAQPLFYKIKYKKNGKVKVCGLYTFQRFGEFLIFNFYYILGSRVRMQVEIHGLIEKSKTVRIQLNFCRKFMENIPLRSEGFSLSREKIVPFELGPSFQRYIHKKCSIYR